jgi:hypothetical protein
MNETNGQGKDAVADGLQMRNEAIDAIQERGCATVRHLDRDGNVLWEEEAHNALTYWGQVRILSHTFGAVTAPSGNAWHLALLTATPAGKGTAWGSVSELGSSGYARANVASWTRTTSTSSDNSANTGTVTFTNNSGSSWTGCTALAVVDASSGSPTTYGYLSYIALSTTRTLANGDSLQINPYTLTLS